MIKPLNQKVNRANENFGMRYQMRKKKRAHNWLDDSLIFKRTFRAIDEIWLNYIWPKQRTIVQMMKNTRTISLLHSWPTTWTSHLHLNWRVIISPLTLWDQLKLKKRRKKQQIHSVTLNCRASQTEFTQSTQKKWELLVIARDRLP